MTASAKYLEQEKRLLNEEPIAAQLIFY